VAGILLLHGVLVMFDGGVNAFGKLFLNQNGFAPVGMLLKYFQAICAWLLLVDK